MVLVLGISDSVHLVLRYMEERRKGLSRKEAASEMAGAMSRACFLTNFTNGVGFASLATATIATVASFGIYTGIACMLTFVANIAVLPAVLSYWGPDSTTVVDSARIDRWFESFARFLIRRKTPLFVGGIALNVGGVLLGVWLVGVDTKLLEEVPPSNRVHQATKAIEERLTPVIAHDVLVEGKTLAGIDCDRDEDCGKEGFVCNQVDRVRAALTPYRDAFYKLDSPKGLAYLDRLEERLRAAQGKMRGQCIATVQSPELLKALDGAGKAVLAHPEASRHARRVDTLAAVVRQMHKAMKKGAPEADTVPDSLSAVSQLLLPLESAAADLTARYASPDYAATRLTVHLRDHGSIAWKTVEPVLASEVKRRFDRDPSLAERFNYVITGTMSYVAKALSFIIHDLLSSLVTAFIPIFFIIGFLFRSVRIAFLSILPNTIPLAMTLVFMAVAGVNLRVSTIIIFSVSLGIAVNDTIHLLARYKEEIGRGLNREEAVITAVRMVGPGMFIATAILAVGFLVNLVSEFIALKQFGYLASFTMVSALFGDLFLTVPCILILGGKEKKDKRAH
jgi:predicted RND superfamily exporter protein